MDYCHECRRHLNGALACAGCGRPAEELRHGDPEASAADRVFELTRDEGAPPTAPRRAQAPARPGARRAARAARAVSGRRSRRRRGRAALLAATGLVLAAGALSLAELVVENGGGEPATSVRQEDVALPAPLPDPSHSGGGAADPGTVEAAPSASTPPGGPSAPAGDGPGDGPGDASGVPGSAAPASGGDGPGPGTGSGDSGSGGGGKGYKGEPEDPAEREAPPSAPASSTAAPPTGGDPDRRPTATGGAPGPEPTPTPTPTPDPEPSEECTRWLWWCV